MNALTKNQAIAQSTYVRKGANTYMDLFNQLSGRELEVIQLEARVKTLQTVCGEAYQLAGVYDAPVEALDNLSAAANGKPIPHETFLPVDGVTDREKVLEGRVKTLEDALREAYEYYAGPHACSEFKCDCGACGLCEMGESMRQTLAAKELKTEPMPDMCVHGLPMAISCVRCMEAKEPR